MISCVESKCLWKSPHFTFKHCSLVIVLTTLLVGSRVRIRSNVETYYILLVYLNACFVPKLYQCPVLVARIEKYTCRIDMNACAHVRTHVCY